MHLYTYLDNPQQRALHTDTDSVIYIQPRDGTAMVETGDCLGAMTSELKPSELISEFLGPRIMHTKRTIQRQALRQQCVKSAALP